MMKNAGLLLVIVALFVGIVIYSNQRTQELALPTDEMAAVEQPKPEMSVPSDIVTAVTPVVETVVKKMPEIRKVKSFASDIEALEAYHLCKKHSYNAQKCIDTLADYNSDGFTIHVTDGDAQSYVTLPLADQSEISINYTSANVLLGDYAAIKKAADEGHLGADMQTLFAAEITLLTPSE